MTSACACVPATVGAPSDAVAAAAAGAGTGGPSGEAAGLLGARIVGSARSPVLVSGSGNTLQPSSCCAAPPPDTLQCFSSRHFPLAWLHVKLMQALEVILRDNQDDGSHRNGQRKHRQSC